MLHGDELELAKLEQRALGLTGAGTHRLGQWVLGRLHLLLLSFTRWRFGVLLTRLLLLLSKLSHLGRLFLFITESLPTEVHERPTHYSSKFHISVGPLKPNYHIAHVFEFRDLHILICRLTHKPQEAFFGAIFCSIFHKHVVEIETISCIFSDACRHIFAPLTNTFFQNRTYFERALKYTILHVSLVLKIAKSFTQFFHNLDEHYMCN